MIWDAKKKNSAIMTGMIMSILIILKLYNDDDDSDDDDNDIFFLLFRCFISDIIYFKSVNSDTDAIHNNTLLQSKLLL